MIHAAMVLVTATGPWCIALASLGHMAVVGIVRVIMRVSRGAVPVCVRVVVMLIAVRMQAPLGQAVASQADRTDTQPQPHASHIR